MSIILPNGLTPEEIRILQEFRRLTTETLTLETIKAIKHPAAVTAESITASLATKGFLTVEGDSYALTTRARDFLAIEAKPAEEETKPAAAAAPPAAPASA